MKNFLHWLQTQIVLLINNWLVANPPGLRITIQSTAGQSKISQSKAVRQVVQSKAVRVRQAVQSKAVRQTVQSKAVRQAVQSKTVRQTVQSMAVRVGQAVLTTAGKS